jgi:hypothetical protein
VVEEGVEGEARDERSFPDENFYGIWRIGQDDEKVIRLRVGVGCE